MRQEHARLDKIMDLIKKCDRMIEIDIEICGKDHATLGPKYNAIRKRLYKMYANQFVRMSEIILNYEK